MHKHTDTHTLTHTHAHTHTCTHPPAVHSAVKILGSSLLSVEVVRDLEETWREGETCWAKGQKSLSSRLSAGTLYCKRRLMWMDARWVTGMLQSPACFLQTSHLPCPPSARCPPGLHGPCVSGRHSGGCGDSPRLEGPAVRPSLWETIHTAYLSLSGPLCQVALGAPQQRDAHLPIRLERALGHLQWGRDEVSMAGREEHRPGRQDAPAGSVTYGQWHLGQALFLPWTWSFSVKCSGSTNRVENGSPTLPTLGRDLLSL